MVSSVNCQVGGVSEVLCGSYLVGRIGRGWTGLAAWRKKRGDDTEAAWNSLGSGWFRQPSMRDADVAEENKRGKKVKSCPPKENARAGWTKWDSSTSPTE